MDCDVLRVSRLKFALRLALKRPYDALALALMPRLCSMEELEVSCVKLLTPSPATAGYKERVEKQ